MNFGYTKRDYDELTELERMFVRKAYETKLVGDMTHVRNAVFNAEINANRKKGKKAVELFKKSQVAVDKDYTIDSLKTINEIEKRDGKSWVDLVYKRAGMRKPVRKPDEREVTNDG